MRHVVFVNFKNWSGRPSIFFRIHAIINHISQTKLAAGASGAIMKSAENTELVAAIRKIAAGQTCISGEIQGMMDSDPPVTNLTGRQSEVLQSLTLGLTNKDISSVLEISVDTVKSHLRHVFAKMDVETRAEAVAEAIRRGLASS